MDLGDLYALSAYSKEPFLDVLRCRFLSPLAAVPLVTLTGLGLYAHGFPQVRKLTLLGQLLMIACVKNQNFKCKIFPEIMFSLVRKAILFIFV